MKGEIKNNREEVKQIATDIDQGKIETAKEKEDLSLRIQEGENRFEKIQNDKIRNNLIITGVALGEGTEEELRVAIESKMEECQINNTERKSKTKGTYLLFQR
mgnify:FL=1